MTQPKQPLPDFGEPLDKDTLKDFSTIVDADIESALVWFDEHASNKWVGSLEAPFIEGD